MTSLTKKALLIGCNYKNTNMELYGCIHDTIQWYNILQDVYGFNEKDIIFLRDDKSDLKPTKERIITELKNLINSNPIFSCIIFSGHGISIKDNNEDEIDKLDECIVPCDVITAGIITDDELNNIIKLSKSTMLAIFDCCRSGTVLDLPYNDFTSINTLNTIKSENNIICISGCRDNQYANEIFNLHNMLPQGALSISLLNYLRKSNYYPNMSNLIVDILNDMVNSGLNQHPVISSSQPLTTNTMFPLIPTIISNTELFNKNIIDLTSQVSALKTQNNSLTSQISTLKTQNNSLTSQISALKTQNNSLTSQISTLKTQNNSLTSQISTLKTQNNTLNTQISTLRTQNDILTSQISALRTQNNSLTSQISTLRTQNNSLTSQISTLRTQNNK